MATPDTGHPQNENGGNGPVSTVTIHKEHCKNVEIKDSIVFDVAEQNFDLGLVQTANLGNKRDPGAAALKAVKIRSDSSSHSHPKNHLPIFHSHPMLLSHLQP